VSISQRNRTARRGRLVRRLPQGRSGELPRESSGE
jgi:hypothetical protein